MLKEIKYFIFFLATILFIFFSINFYISDDKLVFLKAISNVIKSGMNIMNVSTPEKM